MFSLLSFLPQIVLGLAVTCGVAGLVRFPRTLRRVGRLVDPLTHRPQLALVVIGSLGFGLSALVSLDPWPYPQVHDEFSYLLAADTFAHGRVTNPPHPFARSFETYHVLQQPTYMSKYPPGQGLFLAMGQVLTGEPIVGVWLSMGLACAAIAWMLQGWVPPRWALLGAFAATLQLVFGDMSIFWCYWARSFWGGGVAALGGALVLGAFRRLLDASTLSPQHSFLLGLGLTILAVSRPFEGLVFSLPLGLVLLRIYLVRPRAAFFLPIFLTVGSALAGLGWYNHQITGRWWYMPFFAHDDRYAVVPFLFFMQPRPIPEYSHPKLAELHVDWHMHWYQAHHDSVESFAKMQWGKLLEITEFFVNPALLLTMVSLPWALRGRWASLHLSLLTALLALIFFETAWMAHYGAPFAGWYWLLLISIWRRLATWWKLAILRIGRALVLFLVLFHFGCLGLDLVTSEKKWPVRLAGVPSWPENRQEFERGLLADGTWHLVLVHYSDKHSPHREWVANRADLDHSRIVWARSLSPAEDAELIHYFADRRVHHVTAE